MGMTMKKMLLFSMIVLITGIRPVTATGNIEILGLFKGKAVVKIDGQRRVLVQGESSREGITLISADSEKAVIEVDGERRTHTLNSKISSSFSKPGAGKLITIAPDRGGMYATSGIINGFKVNFLVDTGASAVAMNSHLAKRLGLDYRLEGREVVIDTASGRDRGYVMNLRQVRVGDIVLSDVEAVISTGDFPTTPLLGMSFLGRLNMKREGRLLQLEKKY